MSILWAGYISALAEDSGGVRRVLETFIKQTEGRKKQKPSLRSELAWVIEIESAWLPDIQNPKSKATGLIQFLPTTALQLGTTVDELKTMSRVDQAVYVQKFFSLVNRTASSVGDVYLMVFAPGFVGHPDSDVIYAPGSAGWRDNPGLRETEDGPITVRSVRKRGTPPGEVPDENDLPPKGDKPQPLPKKPGGKKPPAKKSSGSSGGGGLLVLAVLWYLWKKGKRRG